MLALPAKDTLYSIETFLADTLNSLQTTRFSVGQPQLPPQQSTPSPMDIDLGSEEDAQRDQSPPELVAKMADRGPEPRRKLLKLF